MRTQRPAPGAVSGERRGGTRSCYRLAGGDGRPAGSSSAPGSAARSGAGWMWPGWRQAAGAAPRRSPAHSHIHTHTHIHTRTGPARDPPQIPAPAAAPPGPAGSAAPAAGERPRHSTARPGPARPLCALTHSPTPAPGASPLPHPHCGSKGVCAPPERLRSSGSGAWEQRRMLSDSELKVKS